MFLPRSKCVICGENIARIKFNLKTTKSEKSKTLLLKFVEKLYKNISFLHCNICSSCYQLLNELDVIQQREKELFTQLKDFISKVENCKTSRILRQPLKIGKDDMDDELDPEEPEDKLPDLNLKNLPIKVKRIRRTTDDPAISEKISLIPESDSDNDMRNEKVFEQIQSSIQMDLSKHIVQHMTKSKPKTVLCEICGQSFKTKSGYENHMKKHEGAEDEMRLLGLNKMIEGPCFCDVCGKGFNQKASLSRHFVIHTGESRYQCEACGKKFLHHSSFNMHKKIHAGERNFKCDMCDHRFLTNSHLKRHLRATHEKEKNHNCMSCGKKFTENYNLIAHMKIVHKEPTRVDEYVIEEGIKQASLLDQEGRIDVQEVQSVVFNNYVN
ncbi:zinc finger protein 8-like [Euwallacea fornicatus]|uniref:zinc finger protein 8-like n=1 Tax=Euwallacea fornicatus TaxID=995702 RepID=UPI00338F5ADA